MVLTTVTNHICCLTACVKIEPSSGSTGDESLKSLHIIFQIAHSDKEDPNFFNIRDEAAKKFLIMEDRTSQLLLAGSLQSGQREKTEKSRIKYGIRRGKKGYYLGRSLIGKSINVSLLYV